MRTIIIIATFFLLISCSWKKYPTEKYTIPKLYRDLIASYRAGDTLKFKDSKEDLSLFLIPTIDSTLHDKRGHFINAREYKDISIACHELTDPRRGYADYNLILITKYPDEDSTHFDIRLKDFYGINRSDPFVLKEDTVTANSLSFTNYYAFRPYNYAEQKDSNSVSEIYMTNYQGIIAYRCLNGVWWTRIK